MCSGLQRAQDCPSSLLTIVESFFADHSQSSVGREAWFVALHSIHHFALARVILGELGVKVKDTFGLAPSTAVFREWGRKQQKTDQGPKSKL